MAHSYDTLPNLQYLQVAPTRQAERPGSQVLGGSHVQAQRQLCPKWPSSCLHANRACHKDKLDKKGPIHIILGNGGRQANTPYYNKDPEEWIAVRDHTTYGYGTLEFVNVTHARYEWVQTDANDISTDKVKVADENSVTRAKDRGVKDKLYVKNQLYL